MDVSWPLAKAFSGLSLKDGSHLFEMNPDYTEDVERDGSSIRCLCFKKKSEAVQVELKVNQVKVD